MTESNEPRELLPCPFCGGDEISNGWSSPGYFGSMHSGNVECHTCNAFVIAETEAEAIAAWNHRTATEAASAKEVAELREALQIIANPDWTWATPEEMRKIASDRLAALGECRT